MRLIAIVPIVTAIVKPSRSARDFTATYNKVLLMSDGREEREEREKKREEEERKDRSDWVDRDLRDQWKPERRES